MEPTERWLSVDEIAEHLGVASITIYRWLEKNKIPACRVGKQWRFKMSAIDQWVKNGHAADDVNSSFDASPGTSEMRSGMPTASPTKDSMKGSVS